MPKKFWSFRNSAEGDSAELLLYGDIADSSWWGDEVTPKQFADELKELGQVSQITVRINSSGGDVFAAQAIGNMLEQHSAKTIAHIDGLCASAATIVACHCDRVEAATDSTYMVHPVKMGLYGYLDAVTMQQYINALDTIRENIISLYAKKTGRDKDECAGWMDKTSWWTGQQAKDNGFIDELIDSTPVTVENRNGVLFVNHVSMDMPFTEAPEFVQNSLAAGPAASSSVNTNPVTPENHHEEENMEIQTTDDLRREYPALVNEIEQAAVNNERQRIRDIEDMAMPGNEAMTADAKFTNPMNAADYAMAVVRNAKATGANFMANAQEDAARSGAAAVTNQEPAGQGSQEDEFMDALKSLGNK